jgi:nucleotide-binding universal stress UspA family protein
MIPFRRILFPVDFSDSCRALVPSVHAMAGHFGASVTLVHAFEQPVVFYGEGLPPHWPELAEVQKKRLADFAREWFGTLGVTWRAEEGSPGEVIHRIVKTDGADLIMMATKGRGALSRLLIGSVVTKVLHDVSCAVWTSAHQETPDYDPHVNCRSILCAVAWDDEAQVVLQGAAALAKSFHAKLALLHAAEMPPASRKIDMVPYRDQIARASHTFLDKLVADSGLAQEALEKVVASGALPEAIRQEAIRCRADLVVTGRGHAQRAFASIWSSLYGVVRESPCPVLSL